MEFPGSIILLSIQWIGVKGVRDKLLTNVNNRIIFAELVQNWERYIHHYIDNVTVMTLLLKSQFLGDDKRLILGRGSQNTEDVFEELQLLLKHQLRIMTEEPIYQEFYRHQVPEMHELGKLMKWVEKGRKLKRKSQIIRHMNKSWEFTNSLLDMTLYIQFLMSFLEGNEYDIIIGKNILLTIVVRKYYLELCVQKYYFEFSGKNNYPANNHKFNRLNIPEY